MLNEHFSFDGVACGGTACAQKVPLRTPLPSSDSRTQMTRSSSASSIAVSQWREGRRGGSELASVWASHLSNARCRSRCTSRRLCTVLCANGAYGSSVDGTPCPRAATAAAHRGLANSSRQRWSLVKCCSSRGLSFEPARQPPEPARSAPDTRAAISKLRRGRLHPQGCSRRNTSKCAKKLRTVGDQWSSSRQNLSQGFVRIMLRNLSACASGRRSQWR
mmetsp:Transcript_38898/g.90965  ORF Transcript_38898/g.90965 Transcript_38898/m.90965 type:complete len:219 (+) Transcript_38898:91-747(+)